LVELCRFGELNFSENCFDGDSLSFRKIVNATNNNRTNPPTDEPAITKVFVWVPIPEDLLASSVCKDAVLVAVCEAVVDVTSLTVADVCVVVDDTVVECSSVVSVDALVEVVFDVSAIVVVEVDDVLVVVVELLLEVEEVVEVVEVVLVNDDVVCAAVVVCTVVLDVVIVLFFPFKESKSTKSGITCLSNKACTIVDVLIPSEGVREEVTVSTCDKGTANEPKKKVQRVERVAMIIIYTRTSQKRADEIKEEESLRVYAI